MRSKRQSVETRHRTEREEVFRALRRIIRDCVSLLPREAHAWNRPGSTEEIEAIKDAGVLRGAR